MYEIPKAGRYEDMGILRLTPAFKDYIWGGTRLREDFGKVCSLERIAESWELSCHKDGQSTVSGCDEFEGMTLSEFITAHGRANALGTDCEGYADFPVLIKLIDARRDLSVQVHPDDEYALKNEGGYGKAEMWYVIDCDEGSQIIYGFEREIGKEEFAGRIRNDTLLEVLKRVRVKKGDVFFIPPGTVHAIGKGILIAEIQQNSNTTYRIYDYGRLGADGKPRELHTDKALDVTRRMPAERYPESEAFEENGAVIRLLGRCEYFEAYKVCVEEEAVFEVDGSTFFCLTVLEGEPFVTDGEEYETQFEAYFVKKGGSVFITADTGRFWVRGRCSFILTRAGRK